GTAIAALRALGEGERAAEAAVTGAEWPARMQRLTGRLARRAAPAELWLDGGHNPHAGRALAATLRALPPKPTFLVCGMLNTKDVAGYMAPLAGLVDGLAAVSIPGEANTLPAGTTAAHAAAAGIPAQRQPSVAAAIDEFSAPGRRILICGSLYLAGHVLREDG
ncbi:MAG: glutamate ligase domain-containing protein, partial [Paracoccus sp. (in: a-proteobacteria)]